MSKQHKKGKRASKRTVRCTMCTGHRWLGNNHGRFKPKEEQAIKAFEAVRHRYKNALAELAKT